MVPTVEFPPVTPPTCHVTEESELPDRVAANCWVAPSPKSMMTGEIETLMPEVRFTLALAMQFSFLCEMAVTVTVVGFGA
jgi:hypothetical protein